MGAVKHLALTRPGWNRSSNRAFSFRASGSGRSPGPAAPVPVITRFTMIIHEQITILRHIFTLTSL